MTGAGGSRLSPGIQAPGLLLAECRQLSLLVGLETLFLLQLVGCELVLIGSLLQFQAVPLLVLMGAERGPLLLPPVFGQVVFVDLG